VRPARADDAADGRRHAQRASSLAAAGKCRQAVSEYDKALAVLRDPALLFNRGECHRKLGDFDAALEDYNQFLSDLPKAPNRAEVERRIAELSKKKSAAAAPPASARSSTSLPGRTASAPPTPEPTPRTPAPEVAARPAAPAATTPIAPRDVTAPPPAPMTDEAAAHPGLSLGTPVEASSSSSEASSSSSSSFSSSSDTSLVGKPWFWVAVAVVAVGVGVGAFVVFGHDHTNIPQSDLGNYKF